MSISPRNIFETPLSAAELESLGLDAKESQDLAAQIFDCASKQHDQSPIQQWMALVEHVLRPTVPFAVHQFLFDSINLDSDPDSHGAGRLPPAAWEPSDKMVADANVTKLAKSLGLPDYDSLFQWANENRSGYWRAVIDSLGIQFATPPEEIFRQGSGGQQWLPGARFNITDSLFQASPDKPAIVFGNEQGDSKTVSYGELERLVNQVANGLTELGLVAGDPVGVMLTMTIEAVAAYLGAIRAGCVPVSIAESFAPKAIEVRLRLANAKAIFVQDVIKRAGRQLPCLEKLASCDHDARAIVISAAGGEPEAKLPVNAIKWNDFLSGQTEFESVASSADDVINILFSSGTTGEPKAIPWTQATPLKCAADARFHHNADQQSVLAWPTSLGWMMGPWLIFAALLNRSTIALFGGAPHSKSFCRFVEEAKVTMLGVVPSLVRAWRSRNLADDVDWSAIETFSSTGECSNCEDMLFLMSRAGYRPVIEYCGGTEIGGGYLTSTVVQPNIPGCFSTPALGLDLVLLSDEEPTSGLPSADELIQGEVYLIGPSIGLSQRLLNADHDAIYFHDTPSFEDVHAFHAFKAPLPLGRLRRHGDELLRFPEGYFMACGRTDDSMNLGGIKVSAVELERCLNQMAVVKETAAIAVAVENGPAHLVVFAVLQEKDSNVETLQAEMQSRVSAQLNPLFRISRVEKINALPRTASNKVMRRKLREIARTTG